MTLLELAFLATENIKLHKIRSILTMLGLIVGVASVIAVLSIGEGSVLAIRIQYERIGTNNIILNGGNSRFPLSLDNADFILQHCPSLQTMFTTASFTEPFIPGNPPYYVSAALPGQALAQEWDTAIGSFIRTEHIKKTSRVVVLGSGLAVDLYGQENPLGKFLRIRGRLFEIIGVMSEFGVTISTNQDMRAYLPATTFLNTVGGSSFTSITFVAKDTAMVKAAIEEIKDALYLRFGEAASNTNQFTFNTMEDIIQRNSATNESLTFFVAIIASISLIVGGIGIMNIMLVSVMDRTKEIGIQKALGAKYKDLLMQFMLEAVIVSVAGGLMGCLIGIAISIIYAIYQDWTYLFSPQSVVVSFLFSVLVGIIFGVYPASRAAMLDPIKALRQ